MPTTQIDDTQAVLSIRALSKSFKGRRALDEVDLDVGRGEVHALLGQNGSGKSTLIKVLAGYHRPDPGGSATLAGEVIELGSASAARAAGVRFIHQDLGIVPDFDAAENLSLGERYPNRGWVSDRRQRREAAALLADYGVDVDAATPLRSLSAAERSMVAVVRAVHSMPRSGGLLVLDEPTAALPDHEVRHLFALLSEVRRRGGSILYVTHRLQEVFDIADRVTVLRDGRQVGTVATEAMTYDSLVELIVGRPVEMFYPSPPVPRSERVLHVEDLAGDVVAGVSFDVSQGEVVGVAGLVGSGFDEVLSLTFGASPRTGGTVSVAGRALVGGSPAASIRAGLAFAPADRKRLGVLADWSLRENVTLPKISARGPVRWLSGRHEAGDVLPWLDKVDVVPRDPESLVATLSGGNQQKVVLARWLRCGARAFLLEEPTNGVDTGAKQAIYQALSEVAATGAAVVLSSSDTEELCAVCDRVLVLREGRLVAELTGADLTAERLLRECLRDEQDRDGPHDSDGRKDDCGDNDRDDSREVAV